jgi:hypothetical protein
MNKELDFLSNLFANEGAGINLPVFLLGIFLTTVMSLLLGMVYVRFGNALSNRKSLAKTLVLISLTTMLIISIVKSSLALSLGLVGALSIVRFRTAIKEPEELAYFFMSIAIGLGMGANQIIPTIAGTSSIFLIIFIINRNKTQELVQNLIIQFETPKDTEDVKKMIQILENHCKELNLTRMDENTEHSEISFSVSFNEYTHLLNAREQLKTTFPGIRFSFLEAI